MLIKILSPVLILLGLFLYKLLDSPNGDAMRFPGIFLIALGLLLIPIHHFISSKNNKISFQFSNNIFFKISLGLFLIAGLSFGAIFLYEGLNGLFWIFPAGIAAGVGLLFLLASLFAGDKR